MSKFKSFVAKREFRTLFFLVAIFIVVGLINPDFVSIGNIQDSVKSSLLYIVLAIGLTFVLLTGNIDISVGGTLGLSAAVSGVILKDGGSIILASIVAILIGAFIGFINGVGVTKLNVSSFIMTLGMLEITKVVQVIFTKGQWVENLPASFKQLSQAKILGVNLYLIIVAAIVILVHLFLTRTQKGRYFSAIGDNIDGAVSIGVPVKRYIGYSFMASGISAALAGLIFASQIGFISTTAGDGIEMTVIASAVLGGVALTGGVGSVIGATIGAIIMVSINSALIYMKIPAFWNDLISGSLLITIVVTDTLLMRRKDRQLKKARLRARVLQEEVSTKNVK